MRGIFLNDRKSFCVFDILGKSQFVVFSDKALILPRDKNLTLTFRIGMLK
jgi:hypothetical protein